jgi:hypothetical protein
MIAVPARIPKKEACPDAHEGDAEVIEPPEDIPLHRCTHEITVRLGGMNGSPRPEGAKNRNLK